MINKKSEKIKKMFNSISHKYDFLNHFLSLGTDIYWRKWTVKKLKNLNVEGNPLILDLCCGTGDLTIELSKIGNVVGVDFAEKMLKIGLKKIENKKNVLLLINGDGLKLPFKDNSFDIVTVAFGVRNFEDLKIGLTEIKRVLKKGGVFGILEFSKPESTLIEKSFSLYFHKILPFIGNLISKSNFAYSYLPESVSLFPPHFEFKEILKNTGFKKVGYKLFFSGISALYYGEK